MAKNAPRLFNASLLIKAVGANEEKAVYGKHSIIKRKNEKHLRAKAQGKKDINSRIESVKEAAAVKKKESAKRKITVYTQKKALHAEHLTCQTVTPIYERLYYIVNYLIIKRFAGDRHYVQHFISIHKSLFCIAVCAHSFIHLPTF